MNMHCAYSRLAATALATTLFLSSGAALAQTTDFIDLEASLGYSSNPALRLNGESSLFGRISASGVHEWTSEHGSTSLNAYVENTTYFKRYGSKQLFALGAHTAQEVSSNVTVYGNLGFTGDFSGQLSNRLLYVPNQPVVPDPANPLPPPTVDPDLLGFSGRQFRISGDVGASIRSGARSSINISGGAQRSWFTGGNSDANYTSYYVSGGYSHQVSERTSLGAAVSLQRQDFTHGNWANTVNPALTVHTQLTESLVADAAVGVMVIQQKTDGHTDHSVSPSFSGSLCSTGKLSRFCGHVARTASTSLGSRLVAGNAQVAISTSAGVDYYRKLDPDSTVQASLSAVRYSTPSALSLGDKLRTSYVSGVVGYDRHLSSRIFGGVQGGVRKLFQSGPDPDLDFNANVYVRYRLGSLL
jgi:hypothetical protein